jgi:hypothetical protein
MFASRRHPGSTICVCRRWASTPSTIGPGQVASAWPFSTAHPRQLDTQMLLMLQTVPIQAWQRSPSGFHPGHKALSACAAAGPAHPQHWPWPASLCLAGTSKEIALHLRQLHAVAANATDCGRFRHASNMVPQTLTFKLSSKSSSTVCVCRSCPSTPSTIGPDSKRARTFAVSSAAASSCNAKCHNVVTFEWCRPGTCVHHGPESENGTKLSSLKRSCLPWQRQVSQQY